MKRRNIIAFIMFICAFVLVGVGVLSSCSKVSGNSTYNSTPTNSSSSNQNSSNKESNSSTPSSNSSNEPIKKVTITFDANGGLFKDNTSSKKINIDSGIYDLNSVEIPTYTNHYFEGWYDNEDSSKGKLYKGSINVINDITLYASYKDGYSDTYLNAEGFSEWDKNDFSSLNYLNYKLIKNIKDKDISNPNNFDLNQLVEMKEIAKTNGEKYTIKWFSSWNGYSLSNEIVNGITKIQTDSFSNSVKENLFYAAVYNLENSSLRKYAFKINVLVPITAIFYMYSQDFWINKDLSNQTNESDYVIEIPNCYEGDYVTLPKVTINNGYTFKCWKNQRGEIISGANVMVTNAMYCFHAEYEDITLHLEDKTLTFSPYKTMQLDVPSSSTFAGYYSGDIQYFDKSGNLLKPIDYSDLMKLEARYNCTLLLNNSDSSKGNIKGQGNYVSGTKVTIEATPISNYSFEGWYQNTKLVSTDNIYTFEMPKENVTYTAKWASYTVTTNKNISQAGTVNFSTATRKTAGTSVTLIASTNEGYTWDGWYKDNILVEKNLSYTFEMPKESVVYEARWNSYTVTTNKNISNAGTVNFSTATRKTAGTSVTLKATTNDGYTWLGWYKGDQLVEEKLSYTFDMPKESVVYEARWASYTVTTNKNISNAGTVNFETATRKTAGTSVTLKATTNDGYTWEGWYKGDQLVEEDLSYTFEMPKENVVYEARWTYYTITTSKNNEDAGEITLKNEEKTTAGTSVTLEATTNDGYTWLGWYKGDQLVEEDLSYTFEMPKESVVYEARWIKCPVTIVKMPVEEAGNIDLEVLQKATKLNQQITLTAITNDGYTWEGWYKGDQLVEENLSYTFEMPKESVVYEARWTYYTITTSKNNEDAGEITQKNEEKTTAGTSVTLEATTNDGYTWEGWYKGDQLVEDDLSYTFEMPKESVVYEARWTYYTITTSKNNEEAGEITLKNEEKTTAGTSVTLEATTNDGYTWLGWYKNNQLVEEDLSYTFEMPKESVVYEARWIKCPVTIVKMPVEEAGNIDLEVLQKATKLNQQITLTATTNEGYTFEGWYKGEEQLTPNQTYTFNITEEEVTYIAKYSYESLTINYYVDGAIVHTSTITLENPIIDYVYETSSVFYGWYSNEKFNSNDEKVTTILASNFNGNKDLNLYGSIANDHYDFIYQDSNYAISKYVGENSVVTIPSTFNNVPVTKILDNAFENCESLAEITISENVELIGENAFSNCSSLTNITFTKDVTTIGNNAFFGCSSLEKITIPSIESWLKISFTNENSNPLYVSDYAKLYIGEQEQINITIPNEITEIKQYAFAGYNYLESIKMSNNVTNISKGAFYKCDSLQSITIPFVGATLNDATNNYFGYIFGASSYNENSTYVPSTLKQITLLSGVIGDNAFRDCESLVEITISENVNSIGANAFTGCNNIVKMTIPFVGATATGNENKHFGYFFGASDYLANKDKVPNSIKEVIVLGGKISYGAFAYCNNLLTLTIKNNVKNIDVSGVADCKSLVIYCEAESIPSGWKSNWNSDERPVYWGVNENNFVEKDGMQFVIKNEKATLTRYVKEATKIDVPTIINLHEKDYDVENIGAYAFKGYSKILSITIPKCINIIEKDAFLDCTLIKIYCETSSQPETWNDNWNPDNRPVYYEVTNNNLVEKDDMQFIIKDNFAILTNYYGTLESLVIPSKIDFDEQQYDVTTICSNAIENNSTLTNLEIPTSVTTINKGFLVNCTNLSKITLPFVGATLNDVTNSYFGYIFGASSYSENSSYVPSTLKEVIILDGNVANNAFNGCSEIETITFNNAVETIGENAFNNCSSLANITFAKDVTTIGNNAFSGCSSLEKITIPSIESWLKISFTNENSNPLYVSDNAKLYIGEEEQINITIPNEITEIKQYAFAGYNYLENITIQNSVISIGKYAFYKCILLENIVIPNNVTNIERHAFYECDSLQSITIPFVGATLNGDSDTHFGYIFGAESYNENSTYVPSTLKEVIILNGNVANNAFGGCSEIETITFNNAVETIGENAFNNCGSLANITFTKDVTTIGNNAFLGCSSLEKITIPSIKSWLKISFTNENSNSLYVSDNAKLYIGEEEQINITIPNEITEIKQYAFVGYNLLKKILLSNDVSSIGNSAFEKCSLIESIRIPQNVTSIGKNAFKDCNLLTIYCEASSKPNDWNSNWNPNNRPVYWGINENNYKEENGMQFVIIDDEARLTGYEGNDNIINVPSSIEINEHSYDVTSIDFNVFNNCNELTKITLPFVGSSLNGDSNTHFGYIFGAESYKENSSYVPSTLKEVIILNGNVANNAFKYCSEIETITFNNAVETIGETAFSRCSSLTNITFTKDVAEIKSNAFWNCSSLEKITIPSIELWLKISFTDERSNPLYVSDKAKLYIGEEEQINITIPNEITEIKQYAFAGYNYLENIQMSNNVTRIEKYAFYKCNSLQNIIIPFVGSTLNGDSDTHFGYIFGASSYSENSTYVPSTLKEVIILDGNVANNAFNGCSEIETITFNNAIETIGENAFNNCSLLTNITFTKDVTTIGNNAFSGCSSLEKITIPSIESWLKISFTNENSNPLYVSDNAKLYVGKQEQINITIPNEITEIKQYAFAGYNYLESVRISQNVTLISKDVFMECNSLVIYCEASEKQSGWDSNWNPENRPVYYNVNDNSYLLQKNIEYIIVNNNAVVARYIGNEKEVVIPLTIEINKVSYNVTSIGAYAFTNKNSLDNVYVPRSITSIEEYAFNDCFNMSSITLPAATSKIGAYAFKGCTSLIIYSEASNKQSGWNNNWNPENRIVYYNTLESNYYEQDGMQFTISNNKLILARYVGKENNLVIPSSIEIGNELYTITTISEDAFNNCNSLESIEISNSVTTIKKGAFANCSNLAKITIPFVGSTLNGSSNTYFGYIFGASSYNENSTYVPSTLKEVIITGGNSIGEYAFYGCSSLKSITIPNSVTSIGYYAFTYCSSLVIYCEASSKPNGWNSNWNYSKRPVYWGINENNYKEENGLRYVIEDGNAILTRYVGNEIKIEIPNIVQINGTIYNVTSIGESAFDYCDSLKNITIPNSVTSIGESAFSNCSSLESIEIPNSVTSIGGYAFLGCSSLVIYCEISSEPSGWNSKWNSDNRPVYWGINENNYKEENGFQYVIQDGKAILTRYIGNKTTIEIPNTVQINGTSYNVTTIGKNAFYGWCSLESVMIPTSVTSIGKEAFGYCSSLQSITIPFVGSTLNGNSNTHFGYIFGASRYSENSTYVPSTLKEVIILDGNVANNAFNGCSEIETITINNAVETIGFSAFSGCSSLQSITIPFVGTKSNGSSNSHFGYIFGASSYSENSTYVPSTLKEVIILDGNVANNAFNGCSEIETITINNAVETIGSSAFYGCSSLRKVIIEKDSQLQSIGDSAFYECSSLESIIIPNSVTSIGKDAFYECNSLDNVNYGGTISQWSNIDFGNSFSNPLSMNKLYIDGKLYQEENIVLQGNVKIGSYAFYGCNFIKTIIINENVMSIGNFAFYGCSSLTIITIEKDSQLQSIGNSAFYECSSLERIVIPTSVTSIGSSAFRGCSSLQSITIPFVGAKLNGSSNTHFGYIFGASSYSENSTYVPTTLKEVIITGGNSIGAYAFRNCSSLESIDIPTSVTSIGERAFYECSSLRKVAIDKESQLQSIRNYVFYNCSSLESITIPTSVTSIYSNAFYNCSSLESIIIPTSVTLIGGSAFYGCSSLQSITIPFVGTTLNETSGMYFGSIFGASRYSVNSTYVPSTLKEVIITGGDSIGAYAFYGCDSLKNITIPNSVTSIGKSAFSGCSSLESIFIPTSVTSIGERAFEDCDSLVIYCEANSQPSGWSTTWNYSNRPVYWEINENTYKEENGFQYVIQDGNAILTRYVGNETTIEITNTIQINGTTYNVTRIGSNAFSECSSLESIVIPTSVAYIESSAFYECNSLTRVTIDKDSELQSIGESAFEYCSSLKSIIIPNSVTSIGDSAFRNCNSLESITIPNSVTSIGSSAFYECNSLTRVTIDKDSELQSIGESAFSSCSSLKSIIIPNSVTNIGYNAFLDCSSLVIYCEASSQPSGWDSDLNYSNRPVYWGINENIYKEENGLQYVIEDGNAILTRYVGNKTTIEIPNTIQINGTTYNVTSIGYLAFYGCSSLTTLTIDKDSQLQRIENSAFYECNSLTRVTIDKDSQLQRIENHAFSNCSSLKSIEIPNSVTSIDTYAFYKCSSLESIVIPNSVTYIGEYAFDGCSSLVIYCEASSKPSGWRTQTMDSFGHLIEGWNPDDRLVYWGINENTYKEENEFQYVIQNGKATLTNYVGNETTIEIPNTIQINGTTYSVTSIGKSAFYGCSSLKSIIIPTSVTSIGEYAFYKCSSLKSITIPTSVTSIGIYAFSNCSSLKSIVIPTSVTSIGEEAFYNCSSLKSIVIPNSVTSIGGYAFSNCSSLVICCEASSKPSSWDSDWNPYDCSVYWGINENNYKEENGFQYVIQDGNVILTNYVGNETTIEIPNTVQINGTIYNVTSIGDSAFRGCSSLKSINIPTSVTSIWIYAFSGCSSLVVYCEASSQPSGWDSNWNASNRPVYWGINENTYKEENGFQYVIQDGKAILTRYVGNETTIEIPNTIQINGTTYNVTSIGYHAFYNCSSLESIIIPTSVTSIGDYAFYNCSSLESIQIPTSVTNIGNYAFQSCSSLESIIIPTSVTSIGSWAFYVCSSLTIYCEKSSKPNGWSIAWNNSDRPVYWNGQWHYDENGNPVPNN